jgi:alginate O-acetyltransferase complex protein AlgI
MAFSSNFFIFAFLPTVLVLYFLAPYGARNAILLAASMLFYAFDAGYRAWLLIISILLNHVVARALSRPLGARRGYILAAGIAANLAFLLHFKYSNFLYDAFRSFSVLLGLDIGEADRIGLPIGISFFTFQAISYLADVYTGKIEPARRLVDFGAYHALFPQLIAGPIVRYAEIENDLYRKRGSIGEVADGIFRFCIGLAKKIAIADQSGTIADRVFALPADELSASVAWIGVACYTLQIYYDFSGYSDMAIGLGRMLGFTFPENFNQPYRSRSITEFWRRWHMTLSRWFRDYVYIPLGGNRSGPWRTYANLCMVFFLCGLWHGAGYTFILWGLYHGFLLVGERLYVHRFGALPRGLGMWALALLLVMIGWVIFRSATLAQAMHFLSTMFGLSQPTIVYYELPAYLTPNSATFILIGVFFALAPFEKFSMRLGDTVAQVCARATCAVVLFAYALVLMSAHSFNPFIYFRF